MQDPISHRKTNALLRRNTLEMLSKYMDMLQWRNTPDETVLDVGCAGGDVTSEILKPRLPSAVRLFGTDIVPNMITYASRTFPDIDFFVLDMATKNLPSCWTSAFDHILSFYCVHWIRDQRQVMHNIYNMLKPKGDMFIYYVASHPYFDVFFNTSQLTKWKPYISDEDALKYISLYHYETQVQEKVNEMLIDAGFNVSLCKVINQQFKFSYLELKESFTAVNPHYAKIPEHLRDDFIDDSLQELFKLKIFQDKKINENSEEILMQFTLIVIVATKGNIN